MKTCRQCGGHEEVRRGVCAACRTRSGELAAEEEVPEEPSLEPSHDRPWVARSLFVGRKRRSPRQ